MTVSGVRSFNLSLANAEPAAASNATPDRLFAQIAGRIEARIESGEWSVGERIPSERSLAIEFGASRITVREAVLSLQTRGLLSVEQRSRPRIRRPDSGDILGQLSGAARSLVATRDGIADLQEARALFECGLARYAARHATPKQLEVIEQALLANRRSIGDMESFIKTDMDFHLAIAAIAQNPIFTSLHTAFGTWLVGQRSAGLTVRGSIRAVCRAHEAVYTAIAAGDSEAADRAMANHLANVTRYYWKAAGQDPP